MELKRRLSEVRTCTGPHFGGDCTASQSLTIFDGLEGGIFYGQGMEVGWW